MLLPITTPDFLAHAAGVAPQIRVAVMVYVHAAGITMPRFLGYGSMPTLGFSLALSHLAVRGWLVASHIRLTRSGRVH